MIRSLADKDLDEVMEIWLSGNLQAHPFIPTSYWKGKEALVRRLLLDAEVYVFIENKRVAGFIGLSGKGYIEGLFVHAAYRRKGIGKALLDFCAHKFSELSLFVYEENKAALGFYFQNGFSVQKKQKNPETGAEELFLHRSL